MFYELPYIYVILPIILFLFGVAIGLLFLYRKHPKWNRDLPILIVWIIMLAMEIAKQIYALFFHDPHPFFNMLPFTMCAATLFIFPGYLLCHKYGWKHGLRIFASASYMLSLCILILLLIYPHMIIWGIKDDQDRWHYTNVHSVIFHTLVCFVCFWFIIHHTYRLTWFDLIWNICISIFLISFFILMSYLLKCDFAKLWQVDDPFDPVPWSESWKLTLIYASLYIAGGGIGFLIWKLLIQQFMPDLITFRNKNFTKKNK